MFGWLRSLQFWRRSAVAAPTQTPSNRMECLFLTAGVTQTLFDDYATHRHSSRGDEEVGWVLLGIRQDGYVLALAALPAGAERDAGVAHVQFHADAQAVASRIVRRKDKRLQIVGIVHTHPGNMRWPSGSDFEGDSAWIAKLRGGEAVFGIGTADVRSGGASGTHLQIRGDLCFSWYVLASGDARYRPLPLRVELGPDLAMGVRGIWNTIEAHAGPIEHLCRQFVGVELDVLTDEPEHVLVIRIPLAARGQQLRILLTASEARYYWERPGEVVAVDPHEPNLVCAVHMILAELAKATQEIGTVLVG